MAGDEARLIDADGGGDGGSGAHTAPSSPSSSMDVLARHAWTLSAFALTLVVTTASMSLPFPFLSQEFADAAVEPWIVGVVFAALPLGVLAVSPYAPKLGWRFGAPRVVRAGLAAQAACVVGTAAFAGRARWVVWLVFRFAQGVANGATSVNILCLVTRALPEAVSLASGLQEIAAGLGTLIGPIIGGTIYDVSGSPMMPLIVNGVLIASSIVPVQYALTRLTTMSTTVAGDEAVEGIEHSTRAMVSRVLRHPTFVASLLAELVVSTSFGGIPTTLPLYLRQTLDLSPSKIGCVYALLAGLYALCTPLIGLISHDGKLGNVVLCLIGMGSMAVAHLLLGPSTLLNLPHLDDAARWWLCVIAASFIYGVGSAFAFVPLLPLQQAAVAREDLKVKDFVNGLFISCYFTGEMLGQLFGAQIVHDVGYPAASTSWAFAILASASGLVTVQFGAHFVSRYKRIRRTLSSITSLNVVVEDGDGAVSALEDDECNFLVEDL